MSYSLLDRIREKSAEIAASGRVEIEKTKAAGVPAYYVQGATGYLVREMPDGTIEVIDRR